MGDQVPSGMINATDSTSILVFNPLAAAHAGTYTCVVSLGSVSHNNTVMITVNSTRKCFDMTLKYLVTMYIPLKMVFHYTLL